MTMQSPPPPTLVRSALYWGYARLAASPNTLRMDVVSNKDGSLMDTIELVRREVCQDKVGRVGEQDWADGSSMGTDAGAGMLDQGSVGAH